MYVYKLCKRCSANNYIIRKIMLDVARVTELKLNLMSAIITIKTIIITDFIVSKLNCRTNYKWYLHTIQLQVSQV